MAAAFALDSSCMVAAVCSWHERHEAVTAEIERRLDTGAGLAIPAHALLETYSVLTRLPAPHRLKPVDAWALIEANFVTPAQITTLDATGHVRLLGRLVATGTSGGRTYDALIGECASVAKAGAILTLNPRHFEPPPPGMTIVEPDPARLAR